MRRGRPPGHRPGKQARGRELRTRLLSASLGQGLWASGPRLTRSHSCALPVAVSIRQEVEKEQGWEENPGVAYSKHYDLFFFSRTLYCFNLLWGPRLQIDYYHVEGIWEGGLSFSVDPSDRPFLTTCVKNVPVLVTHSTQPLSSCSPYYSS